MWKSKLQWGITSHRSEWSTSKNLQIINVGKGVEKRELSYTLDGSVNWHSHYGEQYGFSSSHVWMWELDHTESWAPKNWCFWTVVLEKTLRVPWMAKRSNSSILNEINSEYLLEEVMLKPKLQYFGHLMRRADSFEKTLMLGKIEGGRRRGW